MASRRKPNALEDPSGLHAGYGRFLCDHKKNRVLFLPDEEAYYRAWCVHFGVAFERVTKTCTSWLKAFDELRRRYYESHPEIILRWERELGKIPPLDRVLTIAARTQDLKRMHKALVKLRDEGVDVPDLFLSVGAD